MVTYVLDASSFQGSIDWAAVDSVVDAGFEKVTEGIDYANPYWLEAKLAMRARAASSGFVPGAYVFLDASESGGVQADWFAAHAGDLTGFSLAVDLERAPNGNPTMQIAQDCVTRLRQHYPGHRVGLYAPHWFTGGFALGFGDWLWASSYVNGSASAAALYALVTESYWAAYGGRSPDLLQFTSSAVVPGVAGACDCSAYRGTLTQLRNMLLPAAPTPAPTQEDTDMADSLTVNLTPGKPEIMPVWAGAAKGEPPAYLYAALVLAATAAAKVTVEFAGAGHTNTQPITVPAAGTVIVTPGKPLTWGDTATVSVTLAAEAAAASGAAAVPPAVRAVLTRWK